MILGSDNRGGRKPPGNPSAASVLSRPPAPSKIPSSSKDVWQVSSYALDLRDFHLASQDRRIIPLLVATESGKTFERQSEDLDFFANIILSVQCIGSLDAGALARHLVRLFRRMHDPLKPPVDVHAWEHSPYRPTPTIIEAAERLFAGHGVADISHAFAQNLDVTSSAIRRAIEVSQAEKRRTICVVTGTPGSGKTLTGLNAVHDPTMRRHDRPAAVFLSGNGPLVKVIREALTRDQHRSGMNRREAARSVSAFIDNVHRFLKTYGLEKPLEPPYENAIIFDEAQRAWDAIAVEKKHGVQKSEPELLLEIMERAPDWCVIVALVGGGQEIHFGEAGLEQWGRALNARACPWQVIVSPEALEGGESVAGHRLFDDAPSAMLEIVRAPELHLCVSVRSPRARLIGAWVNSVVDSRTAGETFRESVTSEYPVVVTRELREARKWVRERADGEQRCGLLTSSGALRLRADGIEVSSGFRQGYSYEEWFLGKREDTRSSDWLEVAATEFECQGLELDWTVVCWGGDFVVQPGTASWKFRKFRGTRWQKVRRDTDCVYVCCQQVSRLADARSARNGDLDSAW